MKLFVTPNSIETESKVSRKIAVFSFSVLICLIFSVVAKLIGQEIMPDFKSGVTNRVNWNEASIPTYYYYFAMIYAPLYEEMCFRLSLRFDIKYISLSTGLLVLLVVKIITGHFGSMDSGYLILDFLRDAAIVAFLARLVYLYMRRIEEKLSTQYAKNYNRIFYSSILLFVVLHIFNYNITDFNRALPFIGLMFFTLTFWALVFSYVRLRNGVWWSFAIHVFVDFL